MSAPTATDHSIKDLNVSDDRQYRCSWPVHNCFPENSCFESSFDEDAIDILPSFYSSIDIASETGDINHTSHFDYIMKVKDMQKQQNENHEEKLSYVEYLKKQARSDDLEVNIVVEDHTLRAIENITVETDEPKALARKSEPSHPHQYLSAKTDFEYSFDKSIMDSKSSVTDDKLDSGRENINKHLSLFQYPSRAKNTMKSKKKQYNNGQDEMAARRTGKERGRLSFIKRLIIKRAKRKGTEAMENITGSQSFDAIGCEKISSKTSGEIRASQSSSEMSGKITSFYEGDTDSICECSIGTLLEQTHAENHARHMKECCSDESESVELVRLVSLEISYSPDESGHLKCYTSSWTSEISDRPSRDGDGSKQQIPPTYIHNKAMKKTSNGRVAKVRNNHTSSMSCHQSSPTPTSLTKHELDECATKGKKLSQRSRSLRFHVC